MILKRLGETTARIPALCIGATGMSTGATDSNIRQRESIIELGLDLGLTFIDTADSYGLSEEVVGRIIRNRDRQGLFLSSKCYPKGPDRAAEQITESLKASLKRLGTDYIDLYQLHWPNPEIPIRKIMDSFGRLVEQGLVRQVGLSNFSLRAFIEAASVSGGTPVSNQLEYNLMNRRVEHDFLPYCEKNCKTLIAYSPLNQGQIFGNQRQAALLNNLSEKYRKTPSQIVLRWLIEHPAVVVVTKTQRKARLIENFEAMNFDLDPADREKIDQSGGGEVSYIDPNRIGLRKMGNKEVYYTVDQALENRFQLFPSPALLAMMIVDMDADRPIRLRPTVKPASSGEFELDGYDLNDNLKRYWAWRLAFGDERPIPAYICRRGHEKH